jgi:hypothetical protein
MATQYTSNTLSSSYYDDFDPNDHYHQILFNNGRALQARELTQLQSMIYAEMGRLGKNIFKEGAVVNPGGSSINGNLDYVTIVTTDQGGDFADIPVGSIFKNPTTNVEAKVIAVAPADGADIIYNTLYIQYTNSGSSVVSSEPTVFGDGQVLYEQTGTGYQVTTYSTNSTGKGVRFTTGEGDFFVLGRFVHTSAQSLILSPYSRSVDAVVGFKVVQDVVTVNDTTDLYDNAGGIVNTASPGADRYRIRLELTTQDKVTSDETFVFLANVENSKIVEEVKPSEAYNQIEELLALRTKEESGNYIVNPFTIHFEDGVANDSNLELVVSSGVAYINGFRVENPSAIKLSVPRPQETQTITNDVVPVVYGNYFLADSGRGMPDLDCSSVNLYNTFGGTGTVLGTARIRAVMEDGANVRVHVFDLLVDSDQSLQNVKSIGTGTGDHFNLVLEGQKAVINDTTNNDLLFPTSLPRPESFDDITLVKQIRSSVASVGTTVTLPQLPTGQSYTNDNLWLASTDSASFVSNITATITNGGRDASITVPVSGTYEVLSYVQKTATIKSKTLTTSTATITSQVDPVSGITYFDFGVPDIFEVDSVRQTNSSGIDLSNIVTLDDGQRDNFYADGRLILEDGQTDPGTLYVKYRHFARGGSGDFYAASSYNVPYADIPDHTLVDGTVVSLRNYLDFRPDKNDGTFSNIFGLPRTGTNITADISYYLPRADKLLITQEGDIQLLMGQQSVNPQFKPTPNNALELYKIVLNANTLDEEDLQATAIEHKRYTMADIAKLEAKLDQLEEFTTLSLLELETKLSNVLDSDGNVRIECGSQTDDFSDHSRTDTNNPDLSSSIDPESKLVRPKVHEDNIRLIIDNTLSSNVIKKGDNVYLNYDSEEWASQQLASRFVKVNPFGLVDNVGTLKLSPSSDEWKESHYEANKAIGGSNKIDKVQAFLWNNWMWNWCGRTVEDVHFDYDKLSSTNPRIRQREFLKLREKYASTYSSVPSRTANGRFVSRVVSSDTLRETIGNRVIDLALVPWIRSRKVYFHAKGLKPNTKFTPFFDGQNVSDWCREEVTFVQWSDRTDDIANQYTQLKYSAHPDGSGELISDENGELIGSFFIPNLRPYYYVERVGKKKKKKQYRLRFRAGIREFKLLDVDTNDWASADSKAFAYYSARGALWNNWGPILSTRNWQYTVPFAGYNNIGIPSVYTPKELQNTLNAVTAANIGILDPQLAGQYGPNTTALSLSALSTLDANGEVSQVLSDYINVNQNQFSGTSVNPVSLPQNPMAQTFKVDNQFGLTLTKVQLYFRSKDSGNLPVSIHLRPVVNGRPSSTDIVPDSHVFLKPSEVDAIGTDPQLSVIQSRPTTFEFEEPIYLQPWTEYAIVVSSQSTDYELFSAKTTETVYGSTSRTVTTQPAPGSLYLPQNGVFWIESKDQDLMFKLSRAKFDIGAGSLVLKNAPLSAVLLEENPIYTTSGSSEIYVKNPEHGLIVGNSATIDSAEAVGGISAATINGSHSVIAIDAHGYKVDVGSNATSTAVGGGDDVLSNRNVVFSVTNPYIETVIPNFTSIDVSAKFTTGRSVSGTETQYIQDAEYQRITPKQNIDFSAPRAIYNSAVENSILSGNSSSYVKVDLKTSNDYVSPIIDLQRASLILVNNVIDDPDVTPAIYSVSETEPYGGTAACKHITAPVMLEQSAVGIEAKFDVNLPSGSDVEFYYRTASADENIYDKNWVLHSPVSSIPNDNDQTFRETSYLPGGKGGTLKPFNQSQIKFVMKSRGGSTVPSIRNMRIKYLAV